MEKQPTKAMQAYAALLALTGWIAVVLQFYLILLNRDTSVAETVIRFFSFFTILSNILVALCCTSLLAGSTGRSKQTNRFFSKPSTLTATAVYITIVGLVYNIVLRILWEPQGLQLWVDEWLHSVMPSFFLLFWLIFIPKGGLKWSHVLVWLIFPFVYLLLILLRGAWSGFYPYPFIDVNRIAYHDVFVNAGAVMLGFLVLSLFLVGIGKWRRG
jgi:hypothetical protein